MRCVIKTLLILSISLPASFLFAEDSGIKNLGFKSQTSHLEIEDGEDGHRTRHQISCNTEARRFFMDLIAEKQEEIFRDCSRVFSKGKFNIYYFDWVGTDKSDAIYSTAVYCEHRPSSHKVFIQEFQRCNQILDAMTEGGAENPQNSLFELFEALDCKGTFDNYKKYPPPQPKFMLVEDLVCEDKS